MQENKTTLLSSEELRQIDEWIAKYPVDRKLSAVIPALHIVQDNHSGWLTNELIEAVADYLEIPRIAAFEVATFYTMYNLSPVGRHQVNVCTNISCQLNGSSEIAAHLKQKLNIQFGETTSDGKVTLREVECLGACVGAPMMQVDTEYHEHLTPARVDDILDGLE